MPSTVEDQKKASRQRQSWLVAAFFAGGATGFIAFWVTLALINATVLSTIVSLVVWPLSRDKGGSNFASRASIVFFVAAVIGLLIGYGTSFGTGLPLNGP